MNYEERFKGCLEIKNELDRANCLFDLLYDLTKLQDHIQIVIPPVNESVGLAKAAINDANAIILECSKFKGDIEPIYAHGYFREKVNRLQTTMKGIEHDMKVAEERPEAIFNNIRFDFSKWKLVEVPRRRGV